jgi:hypothetical protein
LARFDNKNLSKTKFYHPKIWKESGDFWNFLNFSETFGILKTPKNHSIFVILKNIHPKKHTSKAQCVFFQFWHVAKLESIN